MFYTKDDFGNSNSVQVNFNISPEDEEIPLGLEGESLIDPFERPDPDSLDYYGSGDYNGDGELSSDDVDPIDKFPSWGKDVPNPGYTCKNSADDDTTDCADICDGNASECLILDGERNKSLERADVNGDGVVDDTDADLIANQIVGNTDHLPSHWSKLNRTEKIDWLNNTVFEMTRADDYVFKARDEGYSADCTQFKEQTLVNFRWNAEGSNDIGEDFAYSYDFQGRFNVPALSVFTYTDGVIDGEHVTHGLNSIYVGPPSEDPGNYNITDFDQWYFFQASAGKNYVEVGPEDYSMNESAGIEDFISWENLTEDSSDLKRWDYFSLIRRPLRFDSESPDITINRSLDGEEFNKNKEINLSWRISDGSLLYEIENSEDEEAPQYPVHNGSFLDRCYYNFNGEKKNLPCFLEGENSLDVYNTSWIKEFQEYYNSNSQENVSLIEPLNLNQTEGENKLVIYARDIAGNVNKKTFEWTLDTEADSGGDVIAFDTKSTDDSNLESSDETEKINDEENYNELISDLKGLKSGKETIAGLSKTWLEYAGANAEGKKENRIRSLRDNLLTKQEKLERLNEAEEKQMIKNQIRGKTRAWATMRTKQRGGGDNEEVRKAMQKFLTGDNDMSFEDLKENLKELGVENITGTQLTDKKWFEDADTKQEYQSRIFSFLNKTDQIGKTTKKQTIDDLLRAKHNVDKDDDDYKDKYQDIISKMEDKGIDTDFEGVKDFKEAVDSLKEMIQNDLNNNVESTKPREDSQGVGKDVGTHPKVVNYWNNNWRM